MLAGPRVTGQDMKVAGARRGREALPSWWTGSRERRAPEGFRKDRATKDMPIDPSLSNCPISYFLLESLDLTRKP